MLCKGANPGREFTRAVGDEHHSQGLVLGV